MPITENWVRDDDGKIMFFNSDGIEDPKGRPMRAIHHPGHESGEDDAQPEDSIVLMVGDIAVGPIALKDGTVYDVTPRFIEIKAKHFGPLDHHIAIQHEDSGLLDGEDEEGNKVPWVHACSEKCGDEAVDADE